MRCDLTQRDAPKVGLSISVVNPVYNAERFIQNGVDSALAQPETGEVILIEDGFTDNSLEVCLTVERRHDEVRLLRHPGGENRGPRASRNLGIRCARFPDISFLDADDCFLPQRFSVPKDLFKFYQLAEGIYEAVGVHLETFVRAHIERLPARIRVFCTAHPDSVYE